MGKRSNIEWCDASWNPVVGCSIVSPGCKNCYAMRTAHRFSTMPGSKYFGLTENSKAGPVWNGVVHLDEKELEAPLRWTAPRAIFVNSMSDLFHEGLFAQDIERVFRVMEKAPQHTFIILTKRSEAMRRFVNDRAAPTLPNLVLGVSVENQDHAWRAIDLAHTKIGRRVVSAEPLLGPLDLTRVEIAGGFHANLLSGLSPERRIHGVIAGGESGRGARPSHPDWFRSLAWQCQQNGAMFHFKQRGAWTWNDETDPEEDWIDVPTGWRDLPDKVRCLTADGSLADGYGGGSEEFLVKVGVAKSGRLLDGRTYDDLPWRVR